MTLRPDAYPGQPYDHATNQAGHYAAVGITAGLALWPLLGPWTPLVVALVYGLGWEVWWQGLPDWRDGLDDTVHVTAGAGLATLVSPTAWGAAAVLHLAWLALLAVGVRRRR